MCALYLKTNAYTHAQYDITIIKPKYEAAWYYFSWFAYKWFRCQLVLSVCWLRYTIILYCVELFATCAYYSFDKKKRESCCDQWLFSHRLKVHFIRLFVSLCFFSNLILFLIIHCHQQVSLTPQRKSMIKTIVINLNRWSTKTNNECEKQPIRDHIVWLKAKSENVFNQLCVCVLKRLLPSVVKLFHEKKKNSFATIVLYCSKLLLSRKKKN